MRKTRRFITLGILILTALGLFVVYNGDYPSGAPKVVIRNFNPQAGFHYNIYCINHALQACERTKRELVVLLDSGLYQENRPQFIAENPYHNAYDWFSYYFEPINQTNKPLRYWHQWTKYNPLMSSISPLQLKRPTSEKVVASYKRGCPVQTFDFYSLDHDANRDTRDQEFHRIWHQYFKLRPHIQQMVDEFKRKHDFANKYVITLHYRGTDKYGHKDGNEDGPEHPPYEFCAALVKKIIKNSGRPHSDIVTFVATDEHAFIEHMKKADVNAVFIDAIRSNINTSGLDLDFSQCKQGVIDSTPESKIYNELITQSVHRGMQEKSNYIKGRDVLIDAILLGSGNIFIKSRGNVSNQASWIGGPQMESIDLVDAFNAYKKKSPSGKDWRTIYDDL
ncbi:MAG: O-fucosyltransferase family protein [Bacteroidota bacterium]